MAMMNIDANVRERFLKKRPAYKAIIDSKPFKRLDEIHQLGLSSKTLNADYKRSEHSIETCENAIKMLDALEKNSSWIKKDSNWPWHREAVEIAALLHDTGHGPFSHTWECVNRKYEHEKMSTKCVQYIFDNLSGGDKELLTLKGSQKEIDLIKNLITGEKQDGYPGFLFEIVNNKQCDVDVDKWAYLVRDYETLKQSKIYQEVKDEFKDMTTKVMSDIANVFLQAQVRADGEHIEYNFKYFHSIYDLFVLRWKLHLHFYRNILTTTCDYLLAKAVQRCQTKLCDKQLIEIDATNMEAFFQLTDAKLMDLIRDDIIYKHYLNDPQNIVKCITGKRAVDRLVGPGTQMPADDQFYLYGNEEDKQEFERNKEKTIVYAYTVVE